MQCDICGHVQCDGNFKRHAASREVRKNLHGERKDAAPINHQDPVAVPRKPFFGTSENYSNDYVYRSDDPSTTSYSLESVRNYLLRLIVKDKVRIPRQWWSLATQAVFNYEVTHDRQIQELDKHSYASKTQLKNLIMFYIDKTLKAPNPSYAILDPSTLEPRYNDTQLLRETEPFYQQMKNEGLFDDELPKVNIEVLKKEDVPAEVKNDVVMQVEE